MFEKIRDEWFIIKEVVRGIRKYMSRETSLKNKIRCLELLWRVGDYQIGDETDMKRGRGTYYRMKKDFWIGEKTPKH